MDQIDLTDAIVHDSPQDIRSWPVTRQITGLSMRPTGSGQDGLSFSFDQPLPDSWKWLTGNGSDNFQYTVWAGCFIDGKWQIAGFIQMWAGRPSTGAPIITDFHKNWAYDALRWGRMSDVLPKAGDKMAFFVSAGNARGQAGVTSVRERSNIVAVNLPEGDMGDFSFQVGVQVPPPSPAPLPEPPKPLPAPSEPGVIDLDVLGPLVAAISDLKTQLSSIDKKLDQIKLLLDAQAAAPAPTYPTYTGTIFGYKISLTPNK